MVYDRLILEKRATVHHERKQHERGTESRTSFTASLHCGPDVSAVVCNKKAEDFRASRSLSCSICSCAILFRPCENGWFQIMAPGGAGRGRYDHATFLDDTITKWENTHDKNMAAIAFSRLQGNFWTTAFSPVRRRKDVVGRRYE